MPPADPSNADHLAAGLRAPLHRVIDLLTDDTLGAESARRRLAESGGLDADASAEIAAISANLHRTADSLLASRVGQ